MKPTLFLTSLTTGETFVPNDLSNLVAQYDFDVIEQLYQDSARTTPVSSLSDPIGCVKDAKGTAHLIQTTAAKRLTWDGSGALVENNDDWMTVATNWWGTSDWTFVLLFDKLFSPALDYVRLLQPDYGANILLYQPGSPRGIVNGGTYDISSNDTFAAAARYQLAYVVDRDAGGIMYKNGAPLVALGGSLDTSDHTMTSMNIPHNNSTEGGTNFIRLVKFLVYNRVLTADEISLLYENGY